MHTFTGFSLIFYATGYSRPFTIFALKDPPFYGFKNNKEINKQSEVRKRIGAFLRSYFLEDFVRSSVRKTRWCRRLIQGVDNRLIKKYLSTHDVRKIQLGSGSNHLEGWLNTNYYPKSNKVVHVDATRRFPFDDNTFDFVYSEHMIEHIPFDKGAILLAESYRVLKPGGSLRIVTPDFQFLIDLYNKNKTELQQEYIKTATKMFIKNAPYNADIFVINNFFRDWGHQFIYDAETLKKSFSTAGFRNVAQYALNESPEPALANLAHEARYPPGFLKLESLIVQGTK